MEWIALGKRGLVQKSRVVGVGLADSASMKRLVASTADERTLDMTGGVKRRTVLVLDSGHIVLSALRIAEIGRLLNEESGDAPLDITPLD